MAKCTLGKVKSKTIPMSGRFSKWLGVIFELSAGGFSWFAYTRTLILLVCRLVTKPGHLACLISKPFPSLSSLL